MLLNKLHIPSAGKNLVHRPVLFEKLNEGLKCKLILVSATAGYGKTTLISDWIRQSNISTAWCSLDARDNDPVDFLKLVISSVQKNQNEIGISSLELLESPGTASIEYIIELFINDLLTLKNQMVLVLDDLHFIKNKQVNNILSFLIDNKPNHLLIVLSTRSDPALPFARLRSQNEFIEIRSSDLSFSNQDISYFLNRKLKLGLSDTDLSLLEQKTEGWIAGLQLAALTIQGHDNVSGYIEKMAGDNRYIMDYLMEEVLNIQNAEMSHFLVFTSVLDKLSGSLCDALLKKNNSQTLLESLEKSNMFLIPLDNERKWFRYHHLFGDLLKQRLSIAHKDEIPKLHHNASIWFETNHLTEFAIKHSLLAGDSLRAIQLLDPIIEDLCQNLEYHKIFKFGSLFKKNEIIRSKQFCVLYAWTLALVGDLKGAEFFLSELQKVISTDNPDDEEILGKIYLTRSSIAISTSNVKAAFEYSELAIKYLPAKDNSWNIWAFISNGEAYLLQFDLSKCLESYKSASTTARGMNNLFLMMVSVSKTAYILRLQGKSHERYNLCNELLEKYTSNPNIDGVTLNIATSILYSIIGYIQVEWNLVEEGMQNAKKGYIFSQNSLSISYRGYCAINYAETCYKLGNLTEAKSLLGKLEIDLEKDISYSLNTVVSSFKNKLFIEKGEFEKVSLPGRYVSEEDKSNIFEYYFNNITIARHSYSTSNYVEALNLLEELSGSLKKNEAYELLIEVELLKAKAYSRLNEKKDALKSILNALHYSQSEGTIRTFIVEGEEINVLLLEIRKERSIKSSKDLDSISLSYLNELLKAFEKEKKIQKLYSEPILSSRELDTLKLIAANLSNQDIANKLYISLNTVKTHVKNILLKLDADNRVNAVVRAKEQQIL